MSGSVPPSSSDHPPAAADKVGGGLLAAARHKSARRHRRNNVIAVSATGIIVLLSAFWIFAFHLYTVSSNSMAPTLMGMPGYRDRLLCWRLSYFYRAPHRWEIATFQAPQNAANREVIPGLHSGGESGTTVKRVVGMPGERLSIATGDIWAAPLDGGGFRRLVKPDPVQQRMWIGVYDEDFNDLSTDEFLFFWKREGDLAVLPDSTLMLGEGTGIEYLPRARTGVTGNSVSILPGVPDRYILPQDVHFLCANPDCQSPFQAHIHNQKIQARCPICGLMNNESAVGFYGYRSGLPEVGPYSVGTVGTFQGDTQNYRTNSYFFVPDLRVIVEWRPNQNNGTLAIEIHGDGRRETVTLHRDRAEFNGKMFVVSAAPDAEGWIRSEFQRVDGAARLFAGEKRGQVFDVVSGTDDEVNFYSQAGESGVRIGTGSSAVAIRRIDIDRDVHYFTNRLPRPRRDTGEPAQDLWYEIPTGHFLPLGDNTTVSLDGRRWGPVPLGNLKGTVLMIWRPDKEADWL